MGRGSLGPVVREWNHLLSGSSVTGVPEWQLLRRYLDRRDEVAFGAIVERHGSMVLGVCRRILADARDVEDAFQATFLILARKGATLKETDPIGLWLHGVARRVALRARTTAWRRQTHERAVTPPEAVTTDDLAHRELGAVIDEELARLPGKYRAPLVLCYLEGLTHEEAATHLGWPTGSVKGRLSRARDLLRTRLERRGFAPSGGAGLLIPQVSGLVPPSLVSNTIRAAMAGQAAGMIPAGVAALVAGSLTNMILGKLKTAGLALMVFGTGAAVLAYQATTEPGKDTKQTIPSTQPPREQPPVMPANPVKVVDWEAGFPKVTAAEDQSPKGQQIRKKLQELISMQFPDEMPLGDVLKYIRHSTQDETMGLPNGIPMYVDPVGLQTSDKTLSSPVSINLEHVPLEVTLELLLRQLNLKYRISHGVLVIESNDEMSPSAPIAVMTNKAKRGELTREQYEQLIELLKLRNEVELLITPPPAKKGGGFQ